MAKKPQEKELVTEQSESVATQEKPKKSEIFTQIDEFTQSEHLFIISLMNKGKTAKEAKEACIKHRSLPKKSSNTDAVNVAKHRAKYKADQVLREKERAIEDAKKAEQAKLQKEAEEKAFEIKAKEALEVQEALNK
jgi:hypothetical protein